MELSQDFWDLAEDFMNKIHEETGFPVIICDHEGIITKSVDKSRIGDPHAGAQRILRGEAEEAAVSKEEAESNPKVKEGYSCPIIFDCKRVGTFGIGGDLNLTRPLGRIASMVLASQLNEIHQQRLLANTAEEVRAKSESLKDQIDNVIFRSQDLQTKMLDETENVANNMEATHGILDKINSITSQSKILSINASIEAARAGEAGRAFTIVAKQITELAEDTRKSENEIRIVLAIIREAIANLTASIKESSHVMHENTEVMHKSFDMIHTLQDSINELQNLYKTCNGSELKSSIS